MISVGVHQFVYRHLVQIMLIVIGVAATVVLYKTNISNSGTKMFVSSDGNAKLVWEAPDKKTNGAPLFYIDGYKIYHKNISRDQYEPIVVLPVINNHALCKKVTRAVGSAESTTECLYTITNLKSGIHHFAVAVYDAEGTESSLSNWVVVKVK